MRRIERHLLLGVAVLLVWPAVAWAVLDINDRGPRLEAGGFVLRVTNAGIIGNAFVIIR